MRYIALAAALLVAACDEPQPRYYGGGYGYGGGGGVDPTTLLILSRMNQPTYQMQIPVVCNRLGNQTVCN